MQAPVTSVLKCFWEPDDEASAFRRRSVFTESSVLQFLACDPRALGEYRRANEDALLGGDEPRAVRWSRLAAGSRAPMRRKHPPMRSR